MQSESPLFDNMARLMTEAAGAADGVRREVETVMRSQLQHFLSEADLVPREEFEALQEMVMQLREQNEALATKLEALDTKKT